MLTRLKVSGFKNLVNVDVRFGPFTCVAGGNGVGKSNLFDAIQFLSALASDTLIDAARSVRSEVGRTSDVRNLFHRVGDRYDEEMSFEAEMIVPRKGIDDLGQQAKATITFLRYSVALTYRVDDHLPALGSLKLIREKLEHIKLRDAPKHLRFPHTARIWRQSVLQGKRTSPFISTEDQGDNRVIRLSQDGTGGRPKSILAANLPRTILSTVNATESPTALLARREMQSWRLLQLEPSSLREPDEFTTPPGLGSDGSHLAATLYDLARSHKYANHLSEEKAATRIYDQVAARLSELIEDVYAVSIDRDERRELLTLEVTGRDGTVHPARSLSDGTLRFLGLAVLDLDPKASGLICMEEPENGIHPERIPSILRLLQDIATDVNSPVGLDNPLRQMIVNTHSPAVVQEVLDDSLLVAELKEMVQDGRRFKGARFSWLPDTWREEAEPDIYPVAKGELLGYLKPTLSMDQLSKLKPKKPCRVIERPDLQQLLLFNDVE
ncbi:MAG: AAA family ATPase [Candidatus Poribacteria bacterium]|nr:AAA family ATPase [Candidatus Poribacteria bacterium]